MSGYQELMPTLLITRLTVPEAPHTRNRQGRKEAAMMLVLLAHMKVSLFTLNECPFKQFLVIQWILPTTQGSISPPGMANSPKKQV